MRLAIIAFVLGGMAPAQTPSHEKSAIEGRVLDLRGAPLANATLRLQAMRPGFPTLTTRTDSEGRFMLDELESAIYSLRAERAGYLSQSYGTHTPAMLGRAVDLTAGKRLSGVVITMTQQGVIAGTVTDEDGGSIAGVQVHVYKRYLFGGTNRIVDISTASTNPDGTFVVGHLSPGHYYLGATGNHNWAFLPTWFPGTTDFSSAARIDVEPGSDIHAIDLRLRKGAVYSIRGVVTGAVSRRVTLRLVSKGPGPPSVQPFALDLAPTGEFRLPNVAPGTYVVLASPNQIGNETDSPLAGSVAVTVSDHDVDGVTIGLGPGIVISGNVRMEDGSPPDKPVSIAISDYDDDQGNMGVESGDKGDFQIGKLSPHRYRVEVAGLPGSYVKSIHLDGHEITPGNLDLTASVGGTMEIVLSPRAASVAGVIRDQAGNPAPFAMFQIWPASSPDLPRASLADANGRFHISSLTPGDYSIAAWDAVDPSMLQNPDFLAGFARNTQKVSLPQSATAFLDLTMSDRAAVAAEMAKLP